MRVPSPPAFKLNRLAAVHAWTNAIEVITKHFIPCEKAYLSMALLKGKREGDSLRTRLEGLRDNLQRVGQMPGLKQFVDFGELWGCLEEYAKLRMVRLSPA